MKLISTYRWRSAVSLYFSLLGLVAVLITGLCLTCGSVEGQATRQVAQKADQKADRQEDNQETKQPERKRLVEDPYDYSQPPELPQIEVPSSLEVQQSIDRGIEFLVCCQRETGAWGAATNT